MRSEIVRSTAPEPGPLRLRASPEPSSLSGGSIILATPRASSRGVRVPEAARAERGGERLGPDHARRARAAGGDEKVRPWLHDLAARVEPHRIEEGDAHALRLPGLVDETVARIDRWVGEHVGERQTIEEEGAAYDRQ